MESQDFDVFDVEINNNEQKEKAMNNDRWNKNETSNSNETANATYKKTYIGGMKPNDFSKFEEYNVSICMQDVPDSAFVDAKNGKTYLNFRINPKKEVGQYGDTHNVYVSTKEVK